ncbi:MAG: ATP-binding cassette domain-containing protein, partial [Clostridia bacterium]|nr:ATP-binding cassette domain-containing protein [Clostridia bacterium]
MLKLKGVSKTYISKGKQKVEALKDINLEIGDGGLVFILGKSGSGKSTLLNILGGIDGATSGEIFVNDQSFADFKQADYDNYRNGYVGFVFQEFNLLNDFDVAGNVALALRLSRETEISD